MLNNNRQLECSPNHSQEVLNDLRIYSQTSDNIDSMSKHFDLNQELNKNCQSSLPMNGTGVKLVCSKKKHSEDELGECEVEHKKPKHCNTNPITNNALDDISGNISQLDNGNPNVGASSTAAACIANNFNSATQSASCKLQDLYPISKGEIHKISEKPDCESDASHLMSAGSQSATIINCPVSNTYGARLLTKMGWRFGEGLGKDGDGIVRAVRFEMKKDRMGLAAANEKCQPKIKNPPNVKEKNPVSILMEYCQKNKLSPPIYTDVEEIGPSNMRHFRISVTILNNTYLSPDFYKTKKEARAGSALIAAKEMNLL